MQQLADYWYQHVKPYIAGVPPTSQRVTVANFNLWEAWVKGGIRPNTSLEVVTSAKGLTRKV